MAPKKITKSKASKPTKKATASVSAPSKSYKDLITEAAIALKSRKGVSRPALKKYIKEKYPTAGESSTFDHYFNSAIKKGVETGDFEQPKGPSGTLKIVKKPTVTTTIKPVAKKVTKPKAKKTVAVTKKAAAKKVTKPKAKTATAPAALTYKEMIIKSILSINEGKGSSRLALKKQMKSAYAKKLNNIKNFDYLFNSAIKKGVEAGDLAQPKGPSGVVKVLKKGKLAVRA